MKYFKYVVSAVIAISISSVTLANEIKMGKADWDTGYFQAEIYKQALEKMGYKVSGPTVMKPQVFYVAARLETQIFGLMAGLELMMDTSQSQKEKLSQLVM